MSTSSILGGDRAASRPAGRDADALGPSDTSDSGSDVQGAGGFEALDAGEIGGERVDLHADSDAGGTGERGAAVHDTDIVEGADIVPDRVESVAGAEDVDALSDEDLEALAADDVADLDADDDTVPDIGDALADDGEVDERG